MPKTGRYSSASNSLNLCKFNLITKVLVIKCFRATDMIIDDCHDDIQPLFRKQKKLTQSYYFGIYVIPFS